MTIHNPRIGIILPVFNGLPHLPEAVGSVLAQTHGDWRLHCIDDASRDGSWDYLSGIVDRRIRSTRLDRNVGLYGVLDRAVRSCEADFVVILMQDDRLHPGHLETFCRLAQQHPDASVFWGARNLRQSPVSSRRILVTFKWLGAALFDKSTRCNFTLPKAWRRGQGTPNAGRTGAQLVRLLAVRPGRSPIATV